MLRTTVVPDRLVTQRARLESARAGCVGRHVTRLQGLAERLAGGFARAVTSVEVSGRCNHP